MLMFVVLVMLLLLLVLLLSYNVSWCMMLVVLLFEVPLIVLVLLCESVGSIVGGGVDVGTRVVC